MNDTGPAPALPAELAQETSISDLLQPKRELAPSLRILLDERLYEQIKRLSGIMSRDTIFTPRHLVNKAEACFTVITQAITWNLDPSFVSRCTYQTPGGSIGFEGKLVQAILEQSNRFIGAPEATYVGDWSKVTGKFEKMPSQKGNEYIKATWTKADAQGLGIIVRWWVRGEEKPRVWPGENEPFFLTQCFPLNSPLWGSDPRTQIRYLAMRRFATAVAPGILGGMPFDRDELLEASELATDVTPPPRPQRGDFIEHGPQAETGREDDQPDPFEVVDMIGNAVEYPKAEDAITAYRAALEEADKQGEKQLTTVWDNNQALMNQLDQGGHDSVTAIFSREYGVMREAAANREAAAREADARKEQASSQSEAKRPEEGTPRDAAATASPPPAAESTELRGNEAAGSLGAASDRAPPPGVSSEEREPAHTDQTRRDDAAPPATGGDLLDGGRKPPPRKPPLELSVPPRSTLWQDASYEIKPMPNQPWPDYASSLAHLIGEATPPEIDKLLKDCAPHVAEMKTKAPTWHKAMMDVAQRRREELKA